MDPVRFGRVLGAGARVAAKTVIQAADAAAAPNPSNTNSGARTGSTGAAAIGGQGSPVAGERASSGVAEVLPGASASRRSAPAQGTPAPGGIREGMRRFRREVWKPTARLSGVLGLEFAGVFFAVFAVFALVAALRLRTAWRATASNGPEHHQLLVSLGMAAVFGYFCITSFLRARRRARRR